MAPSASNGQDGTGDGATDEDGPDRTGNGGQRSVDVDPIHYQTTAEAYYQSVVGRATAARSRAQAGFAIVSAISGFVIAAAFTTQIDQAPDYTKWPAFFGVGCWVLAAGFFLRASIVQRRPEEGETDKPASLDKSAFVDYVPRVSNQEARRVNNSLVVAGYATVAALVLTMTTVATVVFFPAGPNQVTADVTVTEPYFQQFLDECQVTATDPDFHDLVGTLDIDSLGTNFVALNIEPGVCSSQGELEIPRSAVLQIEEYPQCSLSGMQSTEGALSSHILHIQSRLEFVKTISVVLPQALRSEMPTPSPSTVAPSPRIYSDCGAHGQPFRDFFHSLFRKKLPTGSTQS